MSQLSPDQHARVKAALGKHARQRLPDTDLWPAIQQQAQMILPPIAAPEQAGIHPAPTYISPAPVQAHPASHFRPATIAISIAVLMAVGLLTYALLPAFTNPAPRGGNTAAAPIASNSGPSTPGPLLFSTPYTVTVPYQDSGDQNLMTNAQAQRAQPLNLSQTINGYTLTIKKVYADTNTIVVRCSISGTNQTTVDYETVALTSGTSAAHSNGVMGSYSGKKGEPSECAMEFDATTLKTDTPDINLHLSANLVARRDISNLGANDSIPAKQTLAGPFVFDFNVVVASDIRIVNVGQTVVAHGLALTLERLIITPGQTNIVIRYTAPDSNPNLQWHPVIAAEGADWATASSDNYMRYRYNMDLKGEGAVSQLPDGSSAYEIVGNLYDKIGAWTVTVKELDSVDKTTDKEQHIAGPWVFQFDVPAK